MTTAVAFIFSQPIEAASTRSETSGDTAEVEAISCRLLAKQLDFLRLGLQLKQRGESKRLGRERRFTIYALTNSTLTSIGAFMAGAGRLHYARRPESAPNSLFENATIVRVTANSISAGGVLVEIGKDSIDALVDHRKKLNLKSIGTQANSLQNEISELEKQRAAMVTQLSDAKKKQIYEMEGILLNNVHEAALDELAAFYSDAQGKRARRIVQLALVGVSNLVSGAGSLYSGVIVPHKYRDNPNKRVRYAGVGGITDIATGSVNVATPILATGAEILRRHSTKAVLFKQLGAHDVQDLVDLKNNEDTIQLRARDLDIPLPKEFKIRRQAIATLIAILEKHREINEKERRNAVNKLILSVIDSGADASGSFSKIVNGVGTVVGSYQYTHDANKRFRVTGGTGIAYGAGNAIAVEEVIRDAITREMKNSRDKKKHQTLLQVLGDEISELQQSQAMLEQR